MDTFKGMCPAVRRQVAHSAIAYCLRLNPKTVRNHVFNVFDKLSVARYHAGAIIRDLDAGFRTERKVAKAGATVADGGIDLCHRHENTPSFRDTGSLLIAPASAAVSQVVYVILSPDAGTQGNLIQRIAALNVQNSSAILGWTYFGAITNLLNCVFLCWLITRVMQSEPTDSLLRILSIVGAVGFLMFGLLNKVFKATSRTMRLAVCHRA